MDAFGYLEVRGGPLLGRGLELAADYLYEVGSGDECHLQLSREGVAEVHAQLHVHEGRLVLTTLAETQVNGFPVAGSVYLDPGDLLGLAGVEVHYTQERPEPREPVQVAADPLTDALQEQERLRGEAVALSGEASALRGERDELRAEVERLRQALCEGADERQQLDTALEAERAQARQALVEHESARRGLKDEVGAAEAARARLDEDLQATLREVGELHDKQRELSEQLSQAIAGVLPDGGLRVRVAELEQELADARRRLTAFENRTREGVRALTRAQEENARLEEFQEDLEEMLRDSRKEVVEAKQRAAKADLLAQDLEAAQRLLEERGGELERHRVALGSLRKERDELRAAQQRAEAHLLRSRREAEEAREEAERERAALVRRAEGLQETLRGRSKGGSAAPGGAAKKRAGQVKMDSLLERAEAAGATRPAQPSPPEPASPTAAGAPRSTPSGRQRQQPRPQRRRRQGPQGQAKRPPGPAAKRQPPQSPAS